MPTPSIQTLRADAQQVLNLDSISAVRSVVAATLANANAGTPLNPNLTTQQLWNEFYQIVTQPKSDIESIIANQLMKFLYAPPAPGGAGADKQVIFNDGGVLAGDPGLTFDKVTNALTITGDLTVDTNTLKVDSTNNRVGVLTASPAQALDVASGNLQVRTGGTIYSDTFSNYGAALQINAAGSLPLRLQIGGSNAYEITSGNVHTWQNVGGVAGTAMTLNATGLGVGGSPSYKLDVQGTSAGVLRLVNILNLSTDPAAVTRLSLDGQGATWHLDNERTNGIFKITRNSTACLTIDNSANVGIGVTPSAWSLAGYKGLEIGVVGNGIFSGLGDVNISSNAYYNGGWKYAQSSVAASSYQQNAGQHIFKTAAGGTAGNAITFTQAMTLDASGRLILLASTTTPATLATNGQLTFTATSNTNLRFSYRGSDGVTRTADLTLA